MKNFKLIEWVMFINHSTVIQPNWSVIRTTARVYACLNPLQRRFIAVEWCALVYYDTFEKIQRTQMKYSRAEKKEHNSEHSIDICWRYLHLASHNKRFMKYFIFFAWKVSLVLLKGISNYHMFFFSSFETRTMDCIEIIIRNRADISSYIVRFFFIVFGIVYVCLMWNRSL